jgi:hypothetical protein
MVGFRGGQWPQVAHPKGSDSSTLAVYPPLLARHYVLACAWREDIADRLIRETHT